MLSSLDLPIDFSNFAVVVASKVETNIYRSSIAVIVGQSICTCISFRSLFHLYKSFFVCDLEDSSLDLSFSGHCARRKKRL